MSDADAAAANGQYEVAYHLLAAALHVASDAGSLSQLDEVIIAVERHQAGIERTPHNLDERHASRRGNESLFSSLLVTARAKRTAISARETIKSHEGSGPKY